MADSSSSASMAIFHEVSYVIIESTFPDNEDVFVSELAAKLDQNGARRQTLDPISGRIAEDQWMNITHVIACTSDFPDYDLSADRLKHVVKPTWVQVSISKGRAQQVRQYNPDPAMFLNDMVVHCSGIPGGDKDAIYGAVLAMGGLCLESLTKMCTHLVVLSMDEPACQTIINKGLKTKIVLPHYFDDCLLLKRRISEDPYLLPDAEILRNDHVAPPISKVPASIGSALSSDPITPMSNFAPPQIKATVFAGKTFMLSEDLELGKL
jgi:hypothetical protein